CTLSVQKVSDSFGVPCGNRTRVAAVKEKRFTGIQRKPASTCICGKLWRAQFSVTFAGPFNFSGVKVLVLFVTVTGESPVARAGRQPLQDGHVQMIVRCSNPNRPAGNDPGR